MDTHSLWFLNDGSDTYLNPGYYGTYTAIDLTITRPNLLLDLSRRVLDTPLHKFHDIAPIVKNQAQVSDNLV